MNNVGNEMIVMMLMTSQIYIYDKHQDLLMQCTVSYEMLSFRLFRWVPNIGSMYMNLKDWVTHFQYNTGYRI